MATVALDNISRSLVSNIEQRVAAYSIGLVGAENSTERYDANLLGSGTLVQVGNIRAILTAHHVIEALPTSGQLGLIVSSNAGAPKLEVQFLQYLKIARGTDDEEGPDVGAIILPTLLPTPLVAKKSFVNLGKHRERMLSEPPATACGLWSLCGFQAALTLDTEPTLGFKRLKKFRGFCPVGWAEEASSIGTYDYFTFQVPHGPTSPMPDKLGGTSGGGLWQVLFKQESDGRIEVAECLLSGVAFYQGLIKNGHSLVRCNGRKSIYEATYHAIKNTAGI